MAKLFWTQRQDMGPSGRFGCGMAYDSARQHVVLFGGADVSGQNVFNDTWEWNGNFWTQMADIGHRVKAWL
jgi:hypothetical protein